MSKIKIGVIGAGKIASLHLSVMSMMPGIDVVGITSRTRKKAEQLAEKYSIPTVYDNYSELIDHGTPDALMLLVSPDQMYRMGKNVLSAKLPVFFEKPPGLSLQEASDLADSADLYSTKNMVGFNRRFYSVFHKGKDLINSHGDLLGICIEGHERFWSLEDRLPENIKDRWIFANSTHMIDLLRFFGGEVKCSHHLAKSHHQTNGDQFVSAIEFKSGLIGSYIAHWYSPAGWTVRLFGEGITVVFQPLESAVWIDQQMESHAISPDLHDLKFKAGFFAQANAFAALVRTGTISWPAQTLRDASKTMELANQIAAF